MHAAYLSFLACALSALAAPVGLATVAAPSDTPSAPHAPHPSLRPFWSGPTHPGVPTWPGSPFKDRGHDVKVSTGLGLDVNARGLVPRDHPEPPSATGPADPSAPKPEPEPSSALKPEPEPSSTLEPAPSPSSAPAPSSAPGPAPAPPSSGTGSGGDDITIGGWLGTTINDGGLVSDLLDALGLGGSSTPSAWSSVGLAKVDDDLLDLQL